MCSAARALSFVLFVLTSASFAAAKACSPDTCGLVVQANLDLTSKETAQHRDDCSSFLSVTVIPPTSTIYVTDVRTSATVSDTVGTLSSTEIDTLTSSATVTDVVTISGETTLQLTDTTTTTTTSTFTATSTTVVTSTYTSATTTTTSTTATTTVATLIFVAITTTTETSTTTGTETDTSTSTFLSTAVLKRRATGVENDAVTISPSKIPDYASKACGRGTASYSSACAAWGIKPRTTTKPTPRTTIYSKTLVTATVYATAYITVTLVVEVTNTATVKSTFVTSLTDVQISPATEVDTLTSSATVTTTSTTPTTVTSTETDTSSRRVATFEITTTTAVDIVRATETVSTTTTTVVPWCSANAVLRADGCRQGLYTTYCNMVMLSIGSNYDVDQAIQPSFANCLDACDSNVLCESGLFHGETGLCTLYAYSGSDFVELVPTAGAWQSFELVNNTILNTDCS